MSETLEHHPSEKELALSAHMRRQVFHRSIDAKAAALRAPPVVCPARSWDSVAPPARPEPPAPAEAPAKYQFKETWFQIVDVSAPRQLSMGQIKRAVCDHYGVNVNDVVSARRTLDIIRPRQVAMYLCKELTGLSLPQIGMQFGDRDHTTILHAVRKITRLVGEDANLAEAVDTIRRRLESLL